MQQHARVCIASALSRSHVTGGMPDSHGRPSPFSQIDSAAEQEQFRHLQARATHYRERKRS